MLGFFIFDELPDFYSFIGIILIVVSGIYIVFRENRKIEGQNTMKRVQNWRDYLENDNSQWKQKFIKKKKLKDDDDYDRSRKKNRKKYK